MLKDRLLLMISTAALTALLPLDTLAQGGCAIGSREAARRMVASLSPNLAADAALQRAQLGLEQVGTGAGVAYPIGGIVVSSFRSHTEWGTWLGPDQVWKHDALCIAGDALGASRMFELRQSWRHSKTAALVLFGLGWLPAIVHGASECETGSYDDQGPGCYALATGFLAAWIGSAVMYFRGERAKTRYNREPPASYGASVFARYNQALRGELASRRRP